MPLVFLFLQMEKARRSSERSLRETRLLSLRRTFHHSELNACLFGHEIDPPWLAFVFFYYLEGVLKEQSRSKRRHVTAALMRLTNTYLVPGCRPSLCD